MTGPLPAVALALSLVAVACAKPSPPGSSSDAAPSPSPSTAAPSSPSPSVATTSPPATFSVPPELSAPPPDVAAPPPNATTTASGLAYRVLTPGTGTVHPGTTSTVAMNYTGWTANGKMFDTSFNRGRPKRMPLDKIIRGWSEGLQLMTKGEKARFWIPSRLAFGDRPTQPSAPAGPLVFDVELVDFQ